MNILADRKIRALFLQVLAAAAVFAPLAAVLAGPGRGRLWALLACVGMAVSILAALYRYFRAEHEIMEDAVSRITQYIAGDRNARIACDDEGERNRLFHEVNSLAAILNAHAEQEGRARHFLKDTLSDISHQLKTPLAALNIYNGILQAEPGDPETVKEFTALSEQELDRIETLVQNLLAIAKLDSGTLVLEKSRHRVAELMAQVEGRFAFQARQQGKRLTFSGGEETVLLCDPHWLTEAVGNLVKNALDHTGEGDAVQVSWRAFPSVVQIVVKDSGSGIHPEDLPHIFKRFYRSRFSKDTQGIGLGLSLAKAVVEAHGGTIEVDSRLGAGTAFTLHFLIPTKL